MTLPALTCGDLSQQSGPVVLLLHGFGASEHDLVPIADPIGAPSWASLRAPLNVPPAGAAWFAITRPGSPEPEPVAAATDLIWEWVDSHLLAQTPVIPVGFSQGGLMASQLLRTRPERVPAAVILGGFVQQAPQPADDRLSTDRPPVFWGRGEHDQVIAAHAIARTAQWLPGHSNLTARIYPGLGHGIDMAELRDVRDFLRPHLAAPATSKI